MVFAEKTLDSPGTAIPLGNRVEIFPDQPLAELNSNGGPAFAARLKGEARSELMSILCTSGLPARLDLANALRLIDHPCILRLRDHGVVHWPALNASHYALALDRPMAPRYRSSLDGTFPAMSEDSVNHYFVTPMIGALVEFQRTGISHGTINTTNLFWRDGATSPPQLGECMSVPAGMTQPVLFETIERGLAMPLGRGPGNHVDDCYAFGVTLALLVMGHNPFQGMDDRAIIQAKIERGSFNAIIGNHRLATSHIELLRGLLTDDARQRWSAPDLDMWLSGRRMTPKSSDSGRRASRHFAFAGKEYWQVRPLAMALTANVPEAVKVIENGILDKWLLRSLGDEDRAKETENAIYELKESGRTQHYEDQLVTRVCITLDPAAPIYYRNIAVMPGGIAALLAHALQTGENLQALSEIIAFQFVTLWVNVQQDTKVDYVPLAQQIERMRGLIEKKTFGSGVERVLYELNPAMPCLSPLLKSKYTTQSKQVMVALEQIAATHDKLRPPMDRHLAAFLIVRDRRSEMLFSNLSNPEDPRYGIALLTLFAELQYRYGPDQVSALAQWLFPLVEPGIRRFLSKPMQGKIRKQAADAVQLGDLALLLKIVDDPNRIDQDSADYLQAWQMYQDIQREIALLTDRLENRTALAREVGPPVAATIAALLSISLVSVVLVRALLKAIGG
jgi:hypothetical protein